MNLSEPPTLTIKYLNVLVEIEDSNTLLYADAEICLAFPAQKLTHQSHHKDRDK